MVALWHLLDSSAKIKLLQFQWDHFKTKLDCLHDVPEPPAPHYDPELEPEPDMELARDMQKPPHSPRKIG